MLRKIAWLTLLVMMVYVGSVSAATADLRPFTDVKESDWSAESIYKLAVLGHISGYPDKTFRPDERVTREAFIKMFVSGLKLKAGTGGVVPVWPDVDESRWSYPYIQTAYRHQLLHLLATEQGVHPDKPITREEVAALVGTHLLNQVSADVQSSWLSSGWRSAVAVSSFRDQAKISQNLLPYVHFAVNQGAMLGDSTGNFRPQDSVTRKEAATIIGRLIEQQTSTARLNKLGFYALQSYPNLDRTRSLDRLSLGWAQLEYSAPGEARLNTTSGDFKIPQGWEEVVGFTGQQRKQHDLMIFANQSNLSEFLLDSQAQEEFLSSLEAVLKDKQYNFSGVTIDFEELKDEQSSLPFVQFLQKVKGILQGKTLTVAVPPTTYYKGYDLRQIGEVSDYVVLMAYDFTDRQSRLPSAPLPMVHAALTEALQHIPKEKLVLGISKQANQWVVTPDGAVEYYQPSSDRVEERINQPATTRTFSMPYFLTRLTFADERGQHEIWYEDERSIEAKMWLAKYYGLHGVSFWYVGSLTEKDWSVIEKSR